MISKRNIVAGVVFTTFILIVIISVSTHGFDPQTRQPITSNLPIVVLRMDSITPVDVDVQSEYVTAWMDVIDNKEGTNTFHLPYLEEAVTERYKIGIHIRGQSTRNNPKKPFAVKMYDYNSSELIKKDYPLFGLPAQDKFVLYSACADPSLTRNDVSFDIVRDMGRWVPNMRYVELFIAPTNGTTDIYYPQHYHGIYLLSERVHRGKEAVDVKKMKEEDESGKALTGGYIYKVDKWGAEQDISEVFTTDYANYVITEPSDEVLTINKYGYLYDYVSNVERALMSPNFTSPLDGVHYIDLIDSDSYVDTFIIQELSKNTDAYRLSAYFNKDRNGKVFSGPQWDLDRTYGNALFGLNDPEGFVYSFSDKSVTPAIPKYWPALMSDPSFTSKIKKRWEELREKGAPLSNARLENRIKSKGDMLEKNGAAYRDYNRWGPWWFPLMFWVTEPYSTYQTNVFNDWTKERVKWMDKAIKKLP